MTGGSTGLVPGVDCLPAAVPSHPKFYGDVSYMLTWVKDGPNPGPLAIVAPCRRGPASARARRSHRRSIDTQFDGRAASGPTSACGWIATASSASRPAASSSQQQSTGTALSSGGARGQPDARPAVYQPEPGPARPGRPARRRPGPAGAHRRAGNHLPVGGRGQRRPQLATRTATGEPTCWRLHLHRPARDAGCRQHHVGIGPGAAVTRRSTTRSAPATSSTPARSAPARPWTLGKLSLVRVGKIAGGVNHESVDRFGTRPASPATHRSGRGLPGADVQRRPADADKFAVGLPSQILLGYQVTETPERVRRLRLHLHHERRTAGQPGRPGDPDQPDDRGGRSPESARFTPDRFLGELAAGRARIQVLVRSRPLAA